MCLPKKVAPVSQITACFFIIRHSTHSSMANHIHGKSPIFEWVPCSPTSQAIYLSLDVKVIDIHIGLSNTFYFQSGTFCPLNSHRADQTTGDPHLSTFIKLRHILGNFCPVARPRLITVSWWCSFAEVQYQTAQYTLFLP